MMVIRQMRSLIKNKMIPRVIVICCFLFMALAVAWLHAPVWVIPLLGVYGFIIWLCGLEEGSKY